MPIIYITRFILNYFNKKCNDKIHKIIQYKLNSILSQRYQPI